MVKVSGGGTISSMGKIQFIHGYNYIISLENLLEAWQEFICGKKQRKDVQEFELNLMSNLISLQKDLVVKTYKHSSYQSFNISDPKPRIIHKASVRDRILHHAIYRQLYPFFNRTFIADSYSCRVGKGTHKAMDRFQSYAYKVSQNYTKNAWVLKCDISKFFHSIDQEILMEIIKSYIPDKDIQWLVSNIISGFYLTKKGIGLPLGNLTSQLLVNIYMNEFDQFVKHRLKAKYYIRFADDFIFLSRDKEHLEDVLIEIRDFLWNKLQLQLHPHKTFIQTITSGVDFLGWVHFPDHRVLRTKTKRRMYTKLLIRKQELEKNIITEESFNQSLQSYLGILGHGRGHKISQDILEIVNDPTEIDEAGVDKL